MLFLLLLLLTSLLLLSSLLLLLRSTLWNNPQLSGCLPVSWARKGTTGKGKRRGTTHMT
jgi:hypothetical protein